jgi:hypothetical protein
MGMLPGRGNRQQVEQFHGLQHAFDGLDAKRSDLNDIAGKPPGLRADQDMARLRRLFHAGSDADRLTHRLIIGGHVGDELAHHHLAGMQADADTDRPYVVGGVALGVFQNCQSRAARLLGVVFVGQGRTEYRHDAVAGHAIDRTGIAMDRLPHLARRLAQHFIDTLWIHAGDECQRSLDVGEHDRHDFPFADQSRFGLKCHDAPSSER